MKTKGIIGKRIAHVEQSTVSGGHGYLPRNTVHWIELEDGTRLVPFTQEREDGYDHDFTVAKPKGKEGV